MKKILITLVLVYGLFLMGCPKGDRTVRELREKSAEMSIYGTKLITAVGDAFQAGEISQDQLRSINTVTGVFVTGVGVYRTALAEAERVVKANPEMTSVKLKDIERLFDDQVVSAFFKILVELGAMPLAQSNTIKAIISGIRTLILTIQSTFAGARQELQLSGGRYGLA